MHRHLDDELRAVQELLLQMVDLVDEQFAEAVDALVKQDTRLAAQVVRRDDEVDALELRVDALCERILALYQPVASDLRVLITAIKINTDLERIGDHCKNLAKSTTHLIGLPDILSRTRLREMADAARGTLRAAEEAFLRRDTSLARRVLVEDRGIDQLYDENLRMLASLAQTEPGWIEPASRLVTVSKELERISDHAMNVAEDVIFLIEGLDVRHRGLSRQVTKE